MFIRQFCMRVREIRKRFYISEIPKRFYISEIPKRFYISETCKRFYSEEILQHFRKPKNIGSLNIQDRSVGTATVGSPACGDLIKFQIKVNAQGIIDDTKIKVFGCGSAIASSSYASEVIKGKKLEEALQLSNKQIQQELKLAPVKIHCSMLAEDGVRLAIEDYKKKNGIK